MSFLYPPILMERRLPIINLDMDGTGGCGVSEEMSPLRSGNRCAKATGLVQDLLPTGVAQARFNGTKGKS